ncbi:MAG: hypothetical protein IPL27_23225 [Lewinellaceae bacterium]|nr:hypothetical protein [Lewinellaceae bacterium]
MQAPPISQNPDAWYEVYEALVNTDEQAGFLLDTLQQPLTQQDFDEYDLGGVLLDFLGALFGREKRFEEALVFCAKWSNSSPCCTPASSIITRHIS